MSTEHTVVFTISSNCYYLFFNYLFFGGFSRVILHNLSVISLRQQYKPTVRYLVTLSICRQVRTGREPLLTQYTKQHCTATKQVKDCQYTDLSVLNTGTLSPSLSPAGPPRPNFRVARPSPSSTLRKHCISRRNNLQLQQRSSSSPSSTC